MKNSELARLLAYVTGLVNQELLLRNEYLAAARKNTSGARKSIAGFLLAEADPPPSRCNWTDKEVAMGLFIKVGTTQELEALEAGKLVEAAGQHQQPK